MQTQYDLNLMRAFAALYSERNVTRAAARINISQPAMSALLGRLRKLFNDPLFVRDRYGISPTEKSDQLFPELTLALAQLDRLVQSQAGFDPASAQRRFELSVNDYFEFLLLPRLIKRIQTEAPGISLATSSFNQALSESGLLNGQADLVFGRIVQPPANLVVRPAVTDGLDCLVAQHHPCGKKRLSKRDYENFGHVQVRPHAKLRTGVFQQLQEQGLKRNIACTVTHFLAVPLLLLENDFIATLPTRVCDVLVQNYPVRKIAPPKPLADFPFHIAWHGRHQKDAAHKWLRDMVLACAAEL